MKKLIIILFIIFLIWISIGAFLIQTEHPKGQLIVGLCVCFLAFILMPSFIFYRHKLGKYKKYQIKDDNLFKFKNNN